MTMSTLPRVHSFKDDIAAAINTTPIDELADVLAELWETQAAPLRDQAAGVKTEASQYAEALRRAHYVLGQVQALCTRQITDLAQHAATVAQQREALRTVKKMAMGAQLSGVKAADLLAVLEVEAPTPEFAPVALAFYPSTEYRGGTFTTYDAAVSVTYPFAGWTTVAINTAGGVQVQPTFLVQDRGAIPAGLIELECGMTLQMPLLPSLVQAA